LCGRGAGFGAEISALKIYRCFWGAAGDSCLAGVEPEAIKKSKIGIAFIAIRQKPDMNYSDGASVW
jgi:hypothetical protein